MERDGEWGCGMRYVALGLAVQAAMNYRGCGGGSRELRGLQD